MTWHDRPPGWWQGDEWRWTLRNPLAQPTIAVIEQPSESYDAYHERKKREEARRRVPFGFGRVLEEPADGR